MVIIIGDAFFVDATIAACTVMVARCYGQQAISYYYRALDDLQIARIHISSVFR